MDPKLCLLVVILLAAILDQSEHLAAADFFYNRVWPKAEELEELNLKCIPGRTVIRIVEKLAEPSQPGSGESNDEVDSYALRTHMNFITNDEHCQVCICSVEGKDEYCSKRPAKNVNECLRMTTIMDKFQNEPFDHTRNLAYRIRRDYLWHDDELPYEPKAKCRRGRSYYTNHNNPSETNINEGSDMESLLDYSNNTVCSYCVCTVDGRGVGCINRDPWFCDYFRAIRKPGAIKDMYKTYLEQDRPTYFRQLPWRMRRTMDEGMYDLMETVGGGDVNSRSCVPFVSEYTDCTDENLCSGCNKCICLENNQWSCEKVQQCPRDELKYMDDDSIDNALYQIQYELENQERTEAATAEPSYVPPPPESENDKDLLLGMADEHRYDIDEQIADMLRSKRSINEPTNETGGIEFHHTVDELNEDSLKHDNVSGTLQARKMDGTVSPQASRRTGVLTNKKVSKNSLQIEYNQPKVYDHHLTDNKIDAAVHTDEKYDTTSYKKLNRIIGNHTQKEKDKDLSKLVVNELKIGTEIIGDKNAPAMSNITFTPENDTLTAMAFIAGNLLNQLWNMEKDSSEDSVETENLKHEKIANLLDLFKEPLNLRQENFLKNALEQLSEAIDQDKTLKNVTLCEAVNQELKNLKISENHSSEEESNQKKEKKEDKKAEKSGTRKTNIAKQNQVATEAAAKINSILSMINKFQKVQRNLNNLKKSPDTNTQDVKKKGLQPLVEEQSSGLAQGESESLNVFGKILEKITKLLMPRKKGKKMAKGIKNLNVLKNTKHMAETLKSMYNIDVDDSKFTAKDKIVFDYLTTVQKNPTCFLEHLKSDNTKPVSVIEGNILLNLSEFYKVKSLIDLLKLIEPETKTNIRTSVLTTSNDAEKVTEKVTEKTTSTTTYVRATTELSNKLTKTKEKLKTHLKTIIDDLIELQNAKGQHTNNINIADALPCIYNILNADKETGSRVLNIRETISPTDKVGKIFNTLKKDLQSAQTRRSGIVLGQRPKSAVVWERLIGNFDGKNKKNTRRNIVTDLKTFDEIKQMIAEIQLNPNTYKDTALTNNVPPSERLVLLKTIAVDTDQYETVLKDVNNYLHNTKDMLLEKENVLKDFIMNAERNINLNNQIIKTINKDKVKSSKQNNLSNRNSEPKGQRYVQKASMKLIDASTVKEENSMKLSRDSIINQLIKNRMQLYVKLKESKSTDPNNDINYDIAKKILVYLESGNYNLARELYKILISHKTKTAISNRDGLSVTPSNQKPSIFSKEPVIDFEEPKNQVQWVSQDAWLKQLVNLKNMKS